LIHEKIGCGTYGSVARCIHRHTQQERAVKSVSKRRVPNLAQLRQEEEVLRLLSHPNIIQLYESFEDSKHLHMVVELCSGGEIYDHLQKQDGGFQEQVAAHLAGQVIAAVHHMHHRRVAHRDLKPENFLLLNQEQNLTRAKLKVIDFGLSSCFKPGEWMRTRACTCPYVAPEVLEGTYAETCDLWSFGVVVYVFLCGCLPFTGDNEAQVFKAVQAADYSFSQAKWKHVSKNATNLVNQLLVVDTNTRLTAAQAIHHEWLSS